MPTLGLVPLGLLVMGRWYHTMPELPIPHKGRIALRLYLGPWVSCLATAPSLRGVIACTMMSLLLAVSFALALAVARTRWPLILFSALSFVWTLVGFAMIGAGL